MGVGIGWRDEGCTSRGVRKKRHPVGWRFLERATGKAAQRRQWRKQQAAFKEVSQWPGPEWGRALADTTRAGKEPTAISAQRRRR